MRPLRNRLRRTTVYSLWRYFRARQQLAAYNRLVDSHIAPCVSQPYSLESTRQQLDEKRSRRRQLFGHNQIPTIVAFGTCDWEQYGFRQSFERVANFHLYDYGISRKKLGGQPSQLMRETLAQEFLEFVDLVDSSSAVTLCFFYADSAYISPQLLSKLAERGIWTVVMGLDDKHRLYERNQYGMRIGQAAIYSHCDLAWTTWRLGADIILQLGGTPWYAPPGADPEFFHPIECDRDIDVVFIGQAYGIRFEIVRFLQLRGFHIETFGSGWPHGFVSHEEMVQLFSRAKIVLGVGAVQSTEKLQHLKGRDFDVPMCGAVYLTSYNPELSDWFEIGREVLCYSSPENCAEVMSWLLKRTDVQETVRRAALLRSRNEHTWEIRLSRLLSLFAG